MTAHGFRAMAATLLNEMGIWNPDAIERQLAHLENNGVRRAYARGEYWDERVKMMQHWSDYPDDLRDGGKIRHRISAGVSRDLGNPLDGARRPVGRATADRPAESPLAPYKVHELYKVQIWSNRPGRSN